MKHKTIKYPAVMVYEWHYSEKKRKKGIYQIFVRFPDLLAIGLPAFTVGKNYKDATKAAKEALEMMFEFAAENGMTLPAPTPIDQVDVRQEKHPDIPEPFRIAVEYISA